MKKTAFCNHQFYLSRTKHIPDKSGNADGTPILKKNSTLPEQFNTYQDSRIINEVRIVRNIYKNIPSISSRIIKIC